MGLKRFMQRLGNPSKLREGLEGVTLENFGIDIVRRWSFIFTDVSYRDLFFETISEDDIKTLLSDPPISNEYVDMIYAQGLLPTPEVLMLAKKDAGEAQKICKTARAEINAGKFDRANVLHMELEYARYKRSSGENRRISFEEFQKFPWVEGKRVIIDKYTSELIKETAEEAKTVLEYIKTQQRTDRPLLVIGNKRYGSLFVVQPIEEQLKDARIQVEYDYIPSTRFDFNHSGEARLTSRIQTILEEQDPDIIIVDGTSQPRKDDKTRFPAAMWGYINFFTEDKFNDRGERYHLKFWAPERTETILVNDHIYIPDKRKKEREVTIVSATGAGESYSNGYFDDPETEITITHRGFTSHGLESIYTAGSVNDFVQEIQKRMQAHIKK